MTGVQKLLALIGLAGLTACGQVDTATRADTLVTRDAMTLQHPTAAAPAQLFALTGFDVSVPEYLVVSEANAYLPKGDIVWRGDLPGNRHQQVKALFEAGLAASQPTLGQGAPARAEITLRRFHGLTEKARYTTGGVHRIVFDITLRDPSTGAVLRKTRTVEADLLALGGAAAIAADAAGQTQKVRLTAHLAQVIRNELRQPGGHQNARLGLVQALNG
ncbi:DUF6778 family protein [Litorisediminicola beolgyonensis]|uniref:DUF6778 family protein n=1 Tax=Litorisediminicola beolgyonensis TaxID=1173614 RepID=A0ABW3ZF90_9RHOB